jgi:hypothetical protein
MDETIQFYLPGVIDTTIGIYFKEKLHATVITFIND